MFSAQRKQISRVKLDFLVAEFAELASDSDCRRPRAYCQIDRLTLHSPSCSARATIGIVRGKLKVA